MSARRGDRGSRRRGSFQEDMVGAGPALDSGAWRRVHPVTPLLNIWQVLAVLVGVVLFNLLELVGGPDGVGGEMADFVVGHLLLSLAVVLGSLLVIVVITGVFSRMAWKRMRYAIDDHAVYLQQGVLAKEQRMARLTRVQAVDVNQPLLARVFGLAKLTIETAGGGDSKVEIQFLKLEEAERLRGEVLARAAGLSVAPGETPREAVERAVAAGDDAALETLEDLARASDGGTDPLGAERVGDTAAALPEREMFRVPTSRLLASLLLDVGVVLAAVTLVVVVVAVVILGVPLASVAAMLPLVLGAGGYVWGRFAGEFEHMAAVSPDGIRMRRGLLEKKSQTLPPGRVQAIELRQGILWRRMGWWRVRVNVAGYGPDASESGELGSSAQNVVLPVGPRSDALTALWLVVRDLGTDDPLATLDAALDGVGEAGGFLVSPRRARLFDPIAWRHNGLLLTRTATIVRRGRLTRSVVVVPHGRTQSLAVEQGPWERRRGLADFVSHSVPGPVDARAYHLDAAVAGEVLRQQAARARAARVRETPEEWKTRVGVADDGALRHREPHAATAPFAAPGQPQDGAVPAVQHEPGGDDADGASGSRTPVWPR